MKLKVFVAANAISYDSIQTSKCGIGHPVQFRKSGNGMLCYLTAGIPVINFEASSTKQLK